MHKRLPHAVTRITTILLFLTVLTPPLTAGRFGRLRHARRCCKPCPSAAAAATTCPNVCDPRGGDSATVAPANVASQKAAGRSLFDGKTLKGWKATKFGGEGEVKVEDGTILLEFGYSMTGITYDGKEPLPKTNYEISLEARRLDGIDFFCGLTFPVEDSHCSLIVGGWAGAIVGLSNIDGSDASENDTTSFMDFDAKRWYRIRVRVTEDHIAAWIDDKQVLKQEVKGHRIDIRPEVDLNCPLGVCTWETKAALRNIRIRKLDN